MDLKNTDSVYRFIVHPKAKSDPRSLKYSNDAISLGIYQVDQINCHDLYFVRGNFTEHQLQQLASQLLHDPVTEDIEWEILPESSERPGNDSDATNIIEVALRPGVTDPIAEQVLRSAKNILAITTINAASTGQRFVVKGRSIGTFILNQLATRLFSNNVIQRYSIGRIQPVFPKTAAASGLVKTVKLRGLDDEMLMKLSDDHRAALNLDEMKTIQVYCEIEKRNLTDIEFEMLAQTWSEHCVHKTFKSNVTVEQEGEPDARYKPNYQNLFNETIRAATNSINAAWVLSAFKDNAGIIIFDNNLELSFKVETHNHPSAIEPFGGANTGIGGVIRDVIGVSAKPVAATDVLCFGPQEISISDIPSGVNHPRRIQSGVVAGIEDYGNKMGIPTVNGAIWYDPGYTANPLVFCGCVGLAPRGSHPDGVISGDHVVVLGGRTGRDGLRGATFSSMIMDAQTGEVSGASVQIGAPIVEKGLVDVLMQARDKKLYHAITDCGAGGLSSAVGEMASKCGAEIQLSHVPLKYPGLAPWEIWLSEAQERMVVAVADENMAALQILCDLYEVEMTDIGHFTNNERLVVRYDDRVVLDLDNRFLHNGLPQRHYQAVIQKPEFEAGWKNLKSKQLVIDFEQVLLNLLSHPNIASKEGIIRVYDHEVQGGTVVKPLSGIKHDGPSDGCVIKPLDGTGNEAFVLSNGLNPEYGKVDPYEMTLLVMDEAVRNAVACGADPQKIAILDNFCLGDPSRPETMGDLVQAAQACHDGALRYLTPFISGKDSFNNEYFGSNGQRNAIPPTLLISAIGVIPDWQQSLTMDLKNSGDLLYLVGYFEPRFGGSHYNLISKGQQVVHEGLVICNVRNPDLYHSVYMANCLHLIKSCHDLSEGGLSVSAAEMAIAGRLGVKINLTGEDPVRELFAETGGCFLVEVSPENRIPFETILKDFPIKLIGTVQSEPRLIVDHATNRLIDIQLTRLIRAWRGNENKGEML